MGATSIFDGLAESNIPLEFHTVIKRMRDGATFRITDHPEDRKAPDIATEEMRGLMAFRAERWAIPG
ncbi:MAG: hypothetical protein FWH02_01515 [Oscillospiraceae bacterium]|nr:hypothetical protein [Oscillospiraceae bacterium]